MYSTQRAARADLSAMLQKGEFNKTIFCCFPFQQGLKAFLFKKAVHNDHHNYHNIITHWLIFLAVISGDSVSALAASVIANLVGRRALAWCLSPGAWRAT